MLNVESVIALNYEEDFDLYDYCSVCGQYEQVIWKPKLSYNTNSTIGRNSLYRTSENTGKSPFQSRLVLCDEIAAKKMSCRYRHLDFSLDFRFRHQRQRLRR